MPKYNTIINELNWLLNKGNNAYLPNVIKTMITNPNNGVFWFLPQAG
jgi:hypothetical protein